MTDHKPLTTILRPKKGLPSLATAPLQRWAMLLSVYRYDIQFRTTTENANADGFSRLPLPTTERDGSTAATLFNLSQIEVLPVNAADLKRATRSDPQLAKVVTYTQNGWPTEIEPELRPYYYRRNEVVGDESSDSRVTSEGSAGGATH